MEQNTETQNTEAQATETSQVDNTQMESSQVETPSVNDAQFAEGGEVEEIDVSKGEGLDNYTKGYHGLSDEEWNNLSEEKKEELREKSRQSQKVDDKPKIINFMWYTSWKHIY